MAARRDGSNRGTCTAAVTPAGTRARRRSTLDGTVDASEI
jgi:hypothetical protein